MHQKYMVLLSWRESRRNVLPACLSASQLFFLGGFAFMVVHVDGILSRKMNGPCHVMQAIRVVLHHAI